MQRHKTDYGNTVRQNPSQYFLYLNYDIGYPSPALAKAGDGAVICAARAALTVDQDLREPRRIWNRFRGPLQGANSGLEERRSRNRISLLRQTVAPNLPDGPSCDHLAKRRRRPHEAPRSRKAYRDCGNELRNYSNMLNSAVLFSSNTARPFRSLRTAPLLPRWKRQE